MTNTFTIGGGISGHSTSADPAHSVGGRKTGSPRLARQTIDCQGRSFRCWAAVALVDELFSRFWWIAVDHDSLYLFAKISVCCRHLVELVEEVEISFNAIGIIPGCDPLPGILKVERVL